MIAGRAPVLTGCNRPRILTIISLGDRGISGVQRRVLLTESGKYALTERDGYWFTSGWRTLRRQFCEVAWREAGVLISRIELCGYINSNESEEYFLNLYEIIEQRARSSAMWSAALDLFPIPFDLSVILNPQRQALIGQMDVAPSAAFKSLLRRPLEQARRLILPGSIQRRKNWETIDRISRALFDSSLPQYYRNSMEHAEVVSAELLKRYPTSRNLRLSPSSIKQYFEDFLPDTALFTADGHIDLLHVRDNESEDDAELIRRLDIASVVLDDCIAELDEIKRELLHTVYGVGAAGNVIWKSAIAFRRGRNLSRHAFDVLHEQALLELQHRLYNMAVL